MILLVACAEPEPAPRDQDTVTHDVFAHWFASDDAAITADIEELRELLDESTFPIDGGLSELSGSEAVTAGAPDVDPSTARGIFTAGVIDCTAEELERLLTNAHQDELYTENYTSYERTYTSSLDDFEAGLPHLTWDTSYGATIPLTGSYEADIHGGLHRAAAVEDGPGYVSTTVMPEPAEPDPATITFDSDFQVEVYYPHDGGMVHYFGMWRHIDLGNGLSTDDDGMIALIVGGLHDWDDTTSQICADGV